MSADLQAIKLQVEQSLPSDVTADRRKAGIVLMLEAANGDSRPLVDIKQMQRFIELNRDLLLAYWDCRISTGEFGRRMKSIGALR
jgi:hypothetical protein